MTTIPDFVVQEDQDDEFSINSSIIFARLKKSKSELGRPLAGPTTSSGTLPYIPSRYTLGKELLRAENDNNVFDMLAGHPKPFLFSSDSKKLKYENLFEDKNDRYPYSSNLYDPPIVQPVEKRLVSKRFTARTRLQPRGSSQLHSPLLMAAIAEKNPIPICDALFRALKSRFPKLRFSVRISVTNSTLQVVFQRNSMDMVPEMRRFITQSEICSQIGLKKDPLSWGVPVQNEESIQFDILLPWDVKTTVELFRL